MRELTHQPKRSSPQRKEVPPHHLRSHQRHSTPSCPALSSPSPSSPAPSSPSLSSPLPPPLFSTSLSSLLAHLGHDRV
eukprot:m.194597 g.194597  ORF g.194597 m.194597 type:complete len:78 (-) comp16795_c5_seq3:5192-5425(-)